MDWNSLLAALVPTIPTLVIGILEYLGNKKDAYRAQILTLISADHVSILENKIPQNSQFIHMLYDKYKKLGGNSYIVEQVSEYDKWVKEFETHKEA